MTFVIDTVEYSSVHVRTPIKREAVIRDGPNTGFLLNGAYTRDVVGTYYNYSMVLDMLSTSQAEYNALYNVLTAPTAMHTVTLPYNGSTLQFTAYIASVNDELIKIRNGNNIWGNLRVTFLSSEPVTIS